MKKAGERNRRIKRELITIDDDSDNEQPAVKRETQSSSSSAAATAVRPIVPYRADLMAKTLRERVIHIVVTARYKSFDDVIARLRKDGLSREHDSRGPIEDLLREVSECSESGRVCLRPRFFTEVNLKWKWFSTEELNYVRRLSQALPSPEIIELQLKCAKLQQANAILEENLQRACRSTREAELRAESAENQLDSKRGIVENAQREKEEKAEQEAKLADLSTRLERALKREEDAYSHNRELIREKDALTAATRGLQENVNFLTNQLGAERMRSGQDRARIDELTCRLAKYEGWPQQQPQPFQMLQRPPPMLQLLLQSLQLQPPQMNPMQLAAMTPPPQHYSNINNNNMCAATTTTMQHLIPPPPLPPTLPGSSVSPPAPPPLVKIVKIYDVEPDTAQPMQQPAAAAAADPETIAAAAAAEPETIAAAALLQLASAEEPATASAESSLAFDEPKLVIKEE